MDFISGRPRVMKSWVQSFAAAIPSGFGAISDASPVLIDVPNRKDATVQISGRSANTHDTECAAELCPLTRWRIGGVTAGAADTDVPAIPTFGLASSGQGMIDLVSVSFSDLTQTRTVSAGTLSLYYWDETTSPSMSALALGLTDSSTSLHLSSAGAASIGDVMQIDSEILLIQDVSGDGTEYTVIRGSHSSSAAAHAEGTEIYHLTRNVAIVPFARDFFGSRASGSYSHSIYLPQARVAAAELFVTNTRGNSDVRRINFTSFTDQGLRTLSGGQISIQVTGFLAIQNEAAPPVLLDATHAVRDIYAVVGSAPSGGSISLQLMIDDTEKCQMTIADGGTTSNLVNGFGLPPLPAGSRLTLNLLAVPQAAGSLPGSDLTVIVRL